MTLAEFKAWFEGYTEGFYGEPPVSKQWKRIQARVKEIDGTPITERVYIDRYWPQYYSGTYCGPYVGPYGGSNRYGLASTSSLAQCQSTYQAAAVTGFNSATAMYALGKADAEAA